MRGTSLVVQWLRLRASNAGGAGSIPGQGTKILPAKKQKKKAWISMNTLEMNEKMKSLSEEIESIKNQMEILELKSTITKNF